MEPKVVVLTGKSTMLQWISAMTPVFLVHVSCWYHIQFWSYDMFCEKDLTRYFEIEENLLFFLSFFILSVDIQRMVFIIHMQIHTNIYSPNTTV